MTALLGDLGETASDVQRLVASLAGRSGDGVVAANRAVRRVLDEIVAYCVDSASPQ